MGGSWTQSQPVRAREAESGQGWLQFKYWIKHKSSMHNLLPPDKTRVYVHIYVRIRTCRHLNTPYAVHISGSCLHSAHVRT